MGGWRFWLICLGLGRSVRVVKLCCVCLKILRETEAAELFFLAIDFIVPLSTPLLLLYVCILVMIIRVHCLHDCCNITCRSLLTHSCTCINCTDSQLLYHMKSVTFHY